MSPRPPKRWHTTVGARPFTILLYERAAGGVLYAKRWDPIRKTQVRYSLGHRDRANAIRWAEQQVELAEAGRLAVDSPAKATVAGILTLYLAHHTPTKVRTEQKADQQRAELWKRVLGNRKVVTLGADDWHAFIAARSRGEIDARGRRVAQDQRRPVRARTVDADLVFLNAVLNWACEFRVKDHPLLARNPWSSGKSGVKRFLARPKEKAPRRPVATYDRFLAVRTVADRVLMRARKGDPLAKLVQGHKTQLWMRESYLGILLDIVEATGRRIGAVVRLWHSDLQWAGGTVAAVRWRPFKKEPEQVVPVPEALGRTLAEHARRHQGLGNTPLFPSPLDPTRHVSADVASDWLEAAEALAGLPPLEGGDFHPYRRKWATERKHLPTVDVMKAGGWRDERALKESYIHADDETMRSVIEEPRKLRDRRRVE